MRLDNKSEIFVINLYFNCLLILKMGIRGMETYLERYNNYACYEVDIVGLITKYRKENNCTPVIAVDGMSVISYIYKFQNLSWIYGGQLKEYEQAVKDFISSFKNNGAELVFFFDGPHVPTKREIWIKRRLDTLDKVHQFLDQLDEGLFVNIIENRQFKMKPSNLRLVTVLVAKGSGCKVYNSTRECDLEIAEYAFQNKCMAILAQDSDFIIFKSAKYYFSMKNFNYKCMTTYNYDREKLASSIGLCSTELPLLASLLGNDIIPSEKLAPFHKTLVKNKWIDFKLLIRNVAKFIKQKIHQKHVYRQILEDIAQNVFNDSTKWKLLEKSILSYKYSAEINRKSGPPTSEDENWRNVLRKAYELHNISIINPTIYSIIALNTFCSANVVEDYRKNDLPATQIILKPLREKLYGILLFENPEECNIEELVMCGPQSLDQLVYITPPKENVEHPGLLSLWKGNTTAQWSIIGNIFNINTLKVRSLPKHLIVPALTLRYLYNKIKFLSWEICAVVSSAVLVNFYQRHELAKLLLPQIIKETRPIRLYSIVSRTYSMIITILNGIGEPIPTQMVSPSNYQDGKLFLLKYLQASINYEELELCDNKKDAFDIYKHIMNFIMESNEPLT